MTTISYKNGVMSSDGKMTLGDMVIKLDTEKVFWVNNHLVGICGRARAISTFVTWLQKMTDYHIVNQEVGDLVDLVPPVLEDEDGYTALVVTPSRQVLMYEGNTPIDMGNDVPMSVGSGSAFALAAMKAGASAEEAVKIACELDVFSGGEITTVSFEEEPQQITREVAETMSKEDLIEQLFGPKEDELVESTETHEDGEMSEVFSWGNTVTLWKDTNTDEYSLVIDGVEHIASDPQFKEYLKDYIESFMEIGEVRSICDDMGIKYSKSNTQQQLIQKIFKEVKSKIVED